MYTKGGGEWKNSVSYFQKGITTPTRKNVKAFPGGLYSLEKQKRLTNTAVISVSNVFFKIKGPLKIIISFKVLRFVFLYLCK